MMNYRLSLLLAIAICGLLFLGATDSLANPNHPTFATPQLTPNYGQLPLYFVKNSGIYPENVWFYAKTRQTTAFFTRTGLVFHSNSGSQGLVYRLNFGNAQAKSAIGLAELAGRVNYLIGNDPQQWHTNIPTFGKICYNEIYPHIALTYASDNGRLKYEYTVAPGGDVGQIQLTYDSVKSMALDGEGNLVIETTLGTICDKAPVAYQTIAGKQLAVPVAFRLLGANSYGFQVGAYDPAQPLVIDPYLHYSTYLGGSSDDHGYCLAVDGSGNAYITGATKSSDFPTTGGAYDTSHNGNNDVFVTKLNSDGTALVYATFIGGTDDDTGRGIALDTGGNAYITGITRSSDFPTTGGAYDTSHNGVEDVFVTKINTTGTALTYSTFLGNTGTDYGYGIAVDTSNNAYVAGYTTSTTFPTTGGVYRTAHNGATDSFVTKLTVDGSGLSYSTFALTTPLTWCMVYGIAVDTFGNAYLSGGGQNGGGYEYGYVQKLNSTGTASLYLATLGSTSGFTEAKAIALDNSGNTYATGKTDDLYFVATPGAYDPSFNSGNDAFVVKVNSSGGIIYATFLGGTGGEYGTGIAVDASGNAYVTGYTDGADFPTTAVAYDTSFNGSSDVFISKLNAGGSKLLYSTYLGSTSDESGYGIALDTKGNIYVTGDTSSSDFPTTVGAYKTVAAGGVDAFVTQLRMVRGIARDFNRDNKSDIFWRQGSTNRIWLMNGGTVAQDTTIATTAANWSLVGTGDLNGDNQCDILWRVSDGSNPVWLMNGTTHTMGVLNWLDTKHSLAAMGDFNGDGSCDILWVYKPSTTTHYIYQLWFMNGTTTLQTVEDVFDTGNSWTLAGVGDFNGDGCSDIFWRVGDATNTNFTHVVWLMNGATISQSAVVTPLDKNWSLAGIGDFDGNGKSDILWRNNATGVNTVWLMNGTSVSSSTNTNTQATTYKLLQVGDFDGDTKSDLLWRYAAGSKTELWTMNGAVLLQKYTLPTMASTWNIVGGSPTSEGREGE